MGFQDQGNNQTQPLRIENVEENDWPTEVQISENYNVYRAICLTMPSEFQHILKGYFGRVRAGKLWI